MITAVRSLAIGLLILAGLAHAYAVMWTSTAVFVVLTIYAQRRAESIAITIARAQALAEEERRHAQARAIVAELTAMRSSSRSALLFRN